MRAAGALGRTWPDLHDLGSTWATWEVLDDFWLAQSSKVPRSTIALTSATDQTSCIIRCSTSAILLLPAVVHSRVCAHFRTKRIFCFVRADSSSGEVP